MHPVEKTAYISLRLSELPVEKVVQNFAISLSNKGEASFEIQLST